MKNKLAILTVVIAIFGLSLVPIYAAVNVFGSNQLSRTSTPPLQPYLIDGSPILSPPAPSEFITITGLVDYVQSQNENMNVIYYRALVPEDNIDEWNFSKEFMERKPVFIVYPTNSSSNTGLTGSFSGTAYVYACCNITKGDLLYTANASNPNRSFNLTLAGTLTNNYNSNWKTRVYNSTESAWGNVNVGKAAGVDAYNRRAILSSDGIIVGYAMQSINVTIPTVIKIVME